MATFRDIDIRVAGPAAAAIGAAGGVVVALRPFGGTMLAAAALLAGFLALGFLVARRPHASFVACIVLLVAVPVYAVPPVSALHLAPFAIGLGLVGVGLLMVHGGLARLRLNAIDLAVLVVFAMLALSSAIGPRTLAQFLDLCLVWLGPYVGARQFVEWDGSATRAARAVALVALAFVPLLVYEWVREANPFHGIVLNPSLGGVWAQSEWRYEVLRAEGSFGHPLGLAVFLSGSSVLALVRVWQTEGATRVRWVAVAMALAAAQILTVSRTGWVVVAVASLLLVLRNPLRRAATALVVAAFAAALVVALIPTMRHLVFPAQGDREGAVVAHTARYRVTLLDQAVDRSLRNPFGQRAPFKDPVAAGNTSIDNGYLALAQEWGWPAAVALLVVVLALLVHFVRIRGPDGCVLAATLGVAVAMLSVSFITQQAYFVWMLIGGSAGVVAARASRRAAAAKRPPQVASVRGPRRVRRPARRPQPAVAARAAR